MSEPLPWYRDGLCFTCTGCGKCCTGFPGYVFLKDDDIQTIALHLKLSKEDFIQTYCRIVDGRICLKEDETTFDCVFYQEKSCSIYKARPTQCKTYPFWKQNLASKHAWNQEASFCEGISPDGAFFSKKAIEEILN